MSAPPLLSAAFSARGGGPADVQQAAVASIRQAGGGGGGTHKIIAQGAQNTRDAIARVRSLVSREYDMNAAILVERSIGQLVDTKA